MSKKYQIYMTCWDPNYPPYEDVGLELYDTYPEAEAALYRDVIDELECLNNPSNPPNENFGHFRIDLEDEDYVAIIRLWDSITDTIEGCNDYRNVTGYNIREIEQ